MCTIHSATLPSFYAPQTHFCFGGINVIINYVVVATTNTLKTCLAPVTPPAPFFVKNLVETPRVKMFN